MSLHYAVFDSPADLCAFAQSGAVASVIQIASCPDGTGRWLLFYMPS